MGPSSRGVVWFLGLAFGAAWLWIAILWQMRVPLSSPVGQLLLLPSGFAPAVAAIVVRKWVTREGFADASLGLRLRAWPYFLFAWLCPLVLVGAVVLLAVGLGFGWPNRSLAAGLRPLLPEGAPVPDLPVIAVLPQAMLTAIVFTPVHWGEEFGWRGYLQQRLFPGRPLAAAAVTGVIWGVWHYPVLLMGYQFPEHRIAGLVVFPVSAVLASVIYGWLLARSGSIWVPSLAHASMNLIGSLTLLLYPDPAQRIFTIGVLGWVPGVAICIVLYLIGWRPARPTAEERGAEPIYGLESQERAPRNREE
jgi:membrane protease YdiL (CAAX protease family)